MRISDWSSDVCSSDLEAGGERVDAILGLAQAAVVVGVEDRPGERRRDAHEEQQPGRSEERRVGKACVSTSRSRCWLRHSKNNNHTISERMRTSIYSTN